MARHVSSKHRSHKISASLLDDIIANVIGSNRELAESNEESTVESAVMDGGDVGNEDDNKAVEKDAINPDEVVPQISDYERARDERVALMRAEFQLRFPTFEKELQDLRVVKTGVKKIRKPKANQIASRRSNRFNDPRDMVHAEMTMEPMIGDKTGNIETDCHENHEVGDGAAHVEGSYHEAGEKAANAEESHEIGHMAVPVDEDGIEAAGAVDDQLGDMGGARVEVEENDEVGVMAALGKFACLSCRRTFRFV